MADQFDRTQLVKDSDELARQPVVDEKEYPRDYHVRTADSYLPITTNPQKVSTNHFQVGTNIPRYIEYELAIDVARQPNRKKARAVSAAATEYLEPFISHVNGFASNGMFTVIAWEDLHTELLDDSSTSTDDNGQSNGASDAQKPSTKSKPSAPLGTAWDIGIIVNGGTSFPIKLKLIRYLDWADFRGFAAAKPGNKDVNVNNFVHAFNIILSHCVKDSGSKGNIVKIGANKFFREDTRTPLGSGTNRCLQLMRGYFYSLKPGNDAILLNINAGCSAFYRANTVDRFLADSNTFGKNGYAALVGIQVEILFGTGTSHARDATARPLEDRVRTIQSWSTDTLEDLKFTHDEEGKIHVTKYLQDRYGLKTSNKKLFAINIGTRFHKAWYAPEHLRIVENQVYRKPVPQSLTKDMVDTACKDPATTSEFIMDAVNHFLDMSRCKSVLVFKNAMCDVPATWLAYPLVRYRDKQHVDLGSKENRKEGKVSWSLKGVKLLWTKGAAFSIKYYLIVCSGLHFGDETVPAYEEEFKRMTTDYEIGKAVAASPKGGDILVWPPAQEYPGEDDPEEGIRPVITLTESLEKKLLAAKKAGANLVLYVQQGKDTDIYSTLKSLCDRKFGLQSLCMTEQANINKWGDFSEKGLLNYMGNIMMKTNLKFEGLNHDAIVREGKDKFGVKTYATVSDDMRDILVLGADVTHPSPGSIQYCPSIASVVGSVNNGPRKFLGSMRIQQEKKEIIQDIVSMVAERIRAWAKSNKGKLPTQILYYRDGVDEGQYGKVKNEEVAKIRDALEQVAQEEGKPALLVADLKSALKITAVVVAKRHHTRFFAQTEDQKEQPGHNENTKPGLLVDRVVTSPWFYDYYLQAHTGLKGTVKPTHYFFLQHEITLTERQIIRLTQALCYTYVRSTSAVSYAAPAYYADRLCERGRCYLRDLFVGAEPYRSELEELGRQLEGEYAAIRKEAFPPPKKGGNKQKKVPGKKEKRPEKSEPELKMQDEHTQIIAFKLKQQTMDWAREEFYRYKKEGEKEGNPWTDEVGEVMFWM